MRTPIPDTATGADLRPALERAARDFDIPEVLLLACALAESGLNSKAARYGAWPDVSFGIMQRIVLYHYYGDRTDSWENIEAVRNYVAEHPEEDLREGAALLRNCLDGAGGDNLLALVIYNHGSLPEADDGYWTRWAGNVASYERALVRAEEMLRG